MYYKKTCFFCKLAEIFIYFAILTIKSYNQMHKNMSNFFLIFFINLGMLYISQLLTGINSNTHVSLTHYSQPLNDVNEHFILPHFLKINLP